MTTYPITPQSGSAFTSHSVSYMETLRDLSDDLEMRLGGRMLPSMHHTLGTSLNFTNECV